MYLHRTLATISLAAFAAVGLQGVSAQAAPLVGTTVTAEDNAANTMVERVQSFDVAQTNEPAMDLEGIRKQGGAEYDPGRKPENIERKGTAPRTGTDEPTMDMRRIQKLDDSKTGNHDGDVGRNLKAPLDGTDEPAMEIEPIKPEGGKSQKQGFRMEPDRKLDIA